MTKQQADLVFAAMYKHPEIRNLFDFWRLGQPANADDWPAFLRAIADGLDGITAATRASEFRDALVKRCDNRNKD